MIEEKIVQGLARVKTEKSFMLEQALEIKAQELVELKQKLSMQACKSPTKKIAISHFKTKMQKNTK